MIFSSSSFGSSSAASGFIKAIESGSKIYTPTQLAIKPKYDGDIEIKIDDMGATHG